MPTDRCTARPAAAANRNAGALLGSERRQRENARLFPVKAISFINAGMTAPETMLARRLSAFPEVERVILFGSRARGDAAPRADIDVAVECPTAHIRRWFEIAEAAENAPTLLKIDLVRLEVDGTIQPLSEEMTRPVST